MSDAYSSLSIGVHFKDECPADKRIPIWLIGCGVLGIIIWILAIVKFVRKEHAATRFVIL